MIKEYQEKGYLVVKDAFEWAELERLRKLIDKFHRSWIEENREFYAEKAINSAYLTAKKHLKDSDRELLFKFIGSNKLMAKVKSIMGSEVAFMNTQLFFDPLNKEQKSYWHRDPQYHMSIKEQQAALKGPNVVHFRVPLYDEPGVELIPGSHRRWDTQEELEVRLEQNGRNNHQELFNGVKVALNAGDLLVFSANMIHRGIYGMDRMSLDILFCDPLPSLLKFVDDDCLPELAIIKTLENGIALENTLNLKAAVEQ